MMVRLLAALWAALLLAGCASLPEDRGRGPVDELTAKRQLPTDGSRDREAAARILESPLDAASAVRLALLRNPDLRAAYAELGLAAADVYEAGRLSNPRLGGSRLDSDEAGALDQVTFGLSQSLASLFTLGDRSALAGAAMRREQAATAARVFGVALDTAGAWYRLAAALEQADVRARVADAAGAAAALGQRFLDAGNLSRLELAELRTRAAEARMAAIDARVRADEARAALAGLMGLDASTSWRIERGLPAPDLPMPGGAELKRAAADNRLDLLAARRQVALLERALDVTRRWRWLGDPELELETERETDGSRLTGAGLSLELPIFDQHGDELARAEARLDAAYARRDAVAARVSRELALSRARLAASSERLAAYRDGLLPEHRRLVEEQQKRVNYMLTGVFELVSAREDEYESTADYLGALDEHWQARLALDRARGLYEPPGPDARRITAESLLDGPGMPSMPDMHQHGNEGDGHDPADDHSRHDH